MWSANRRQMASRYIVGIFLALVIAGLWSWRRFDNFPEVPWVHHVRNPGSEYPSKEILSHLIQMLETKATERTALTIQRNLSRFNVSVRERIEFDPAPIYHGLFKTYVWPSADLDCSRYNKTIPKNAAFVVLLTDNCIIPALVLAFQLRFVCSKAPIVVMSLDKLADNDVITFAALGVTVKYIERDLLNVTGSRGNTSGTWSKAWNKVAAWTLVEYDRLVLLDLDAFPLTNVDELLYAPPFSWTLGQDKGCHFSGMINGGVVVLKPDNAVFQRFQHLVVDASKNAYNFAHAEQGAYELYRYFDNDDHHLFLSPIYNSHPESCECMETTGRFLIKIVHFIGGYKPWIGYSRSLHPKMAESNCRLAAYAHWWRSYWSLRTRFKYLKATEKECIA